MSTSIHDASHHDTTVYCCGMFSPTGGVSLMSAASTSAEVTNATRAVLAWKPLWAPLLNVKAKGNLYLCNCFPLLMPVSIILSDSVHIGTLEPQRDTCRDLGHQHRRLSQSVSQQGLRGAEYRLCNRQEQWMASEQGIFPSSAPALTDTRARKAPLSAATGQPGATPRGVLDLEL